MACSVFGLALFCAIWCAMGGHSILSEARFGLGSTLAAYLGTPMRAFRVTPDTQFLGRAALAPLYTLVVRMACLPPLHTVLARGTRFTLANTEVLALAFLSRLHTCFPLIASFPALLFRSLVAWFAFLLAAFHVCLVPAKTSFGTFTFALGVLEAFRFAGFHTSGGHGMSMPAEWLLLCTSDAALRESEVASAPWLCACPSFDTLFRTCHTHLFVFTHRPALCTFEWLLDTLLRSSVAACYVAALLRLSLAARRQLNFVHCGTDTQGRFYRS